MRRIDLSYLISVLLLVVAGGAVAQAQEPPTALVVFDGSGSMWGKPEGEAKTKLMLAREALRQAFAKVPPEAKLGLISFGHRRPGDCGDVETIVKPEGGTAERIGGVLEKLNPKGRGPVTAALREAAKELGSPTAAASVILVHDDVDNCQADPCSAVADLRRAHPKVAVHVVSIGMRSEDAQKMQCLSKPTGGTHAEVATAQDAVTAIEGIIKTAVLDRMHAPAPERQNAPAAAAAPRATAGKAGLQLSAALVEGGEVLDAPLRWRILSVTNPDAPALFDLIEAAPFVELPGGRYRLEVQYGFVIAQSAIEYAAGSARSLVVPLGAGTILLMAEAGGGSRMPEAVVSFARTAAPNEPAAILRGLVPEVALVPGSYVVTVTSGPTRLERQVTLGAGQRLALNPPLALGEVEIQVLSAANGARTDSAVITIFEDDPDAPLGRREVVRSAANGAVFTLPAGSYQVSAHIGEVETRGRFVVKAGEREQRTLTLDAARLTVAATLPSKLEAGEAIVLRLERIGETKPFERQVNRGSATFVVPAGVYRLEARAGAGSVTAVRELELKGLGQDVTRIEIAAGSVMLRLVQSGRTTPGPDVAWEVLDSTGTVVWRALQAESRPLLAPGRYTVRSDVGGRRSSRIVEIRSGEVVTLEIPGP